MSLELLKDKIGDYAKDIRLNLSVITNAAVGLSQNQLYGIALACAYSTRNKVVIEDILAEVQGKISDVEVNAAKSAASIMAMNNIYYRFVHLVHDNELSKMPAGLRMQVIANSGIDRADFELYSLAVSAINGCGMCMESHVKQAETHGISKQGVQSAIKVAAVINAAAQAVEIG